MSNEHFRSLIENRRVLLVADFDSFIKSASASRLP